MNLVRSHIKYNFYLKYQKCSTFWPWILWPLFRSKFDDFFDHVDNNAPFPIWDLNATNFKLKCAKYPTFLPKSHNFKTSNFLAIFSNKPKSSYTSWFLTFLVKTQLVKMKYPETKVWKNVWCGLLGRKRFVAFLPPDVMVWKTKKGHQSFAAAKH